MCRAVCPVSNVEFRETVTPGNKMSLVDLTRRQVVNLDEAAADALHACTGCGACSEFCMLGNDVATVLVGARKEAADRNVSKVARAVQSRHARSGNPTGQDLVSLLRERLPHRAASAHGRLLPGCTALVHLPEHAANALNALETSLACEFSPVMLRDDAACCGYPLWAAGLMDEFAANAVRFAAVLKGPPVFTSDGSCTYTLQKLYPRVGVTLPAHVTHVVENLVKGNLQNLTPGNQSLYHDPCYLGRKLGIYEPPRKLLERVDGRPPLEFTWHHDKAECCGGGALYPWSQPDFSVEMAFRRVRHEVDELARTGAQHVVTACPLCELQFRRANVPVLDVSRAALGLPADAPLETSRNAM
jgi:glycolate oxidase